MLGRDGVHPITRSEPWFPGLVAQAFPGQLSKRWESSRACKMTTKRPGLLAQLQRQEITKTALYVPIGFQSIGLLRLTGLGQGARIAAGWSFAATACSSPLQRRPSPDFVPNVMPLFLQYDNFPVPPAYRLCRLHRRDVFSAHSWFRCRCGQRCVAFPSRIVRILAASFLLVGQRLLDIFFDDLYRHSTLRLLAAVPSSLKFLERS